MLGIRARVMKRNYLSICVVLLQAICYVCVAELNPHVVLETNFGDITIELYPEDAPVTVNNFLSYVNSGFYDGLLFHRSETRGRQTSDGYYIYTGSLDVLQAGYVYLYGGMLYPRTSGDSIINESNNGLSNVRGTIAMARTTDPDSATAQFFINHQDNTELDKANYPDGYGYCVFGALVEDCWDVMDSIAQTNIIVVGGLSNFFPYNPPVYIYAAYELPCELSYCSDLTSTGQINFEDFALFSLHWLDTSCSRSNGFCNGADLDQSGEVGIVDLDLFCNHWSQTAGYETRFSDLAYNYTIDIADLFNLISRWLDSSCTSENNYCDQADINRDGSVDFIDFSLFSVNWLASY